MDNLTTSYKPIVGKNLIEILMFSMYSDSLIIFREYVQNAFDAIVEAKRQGILYSIKEGQVSITIDPVSRKIRILDNGIGINVSQAQPILLNIADSHKDGIGLAGQYGIGRLVGAKYCKRLIFKTSAKGENRYKFARSGQRAYPFRQGSRPGQYRRDRRYYICKKRNVRQIKDRRYRKRDKCTECEAESRKEDIYAYRPGEMGLERPLARSADSLERYFRSKGHR